MDLKSNLNESSSDHSNASSIGSSSLGNNLACQSLASHKDLVKKTSNRLPIFGKTPANNRSESLSEKPSTDIDDDDYGEDFIFGNYDKEAVEKEIDRIRKASNCRSSESLAEIDHTDTVEDVILQVTPEVNGKVVAPPAKRRWSMKPLFRTASDPSLKMDHELPDVDKKTDRFHRKKPSIFSFRNKKKSTDGNATREVEPPHNDSKPKLTPKHHYGIHLHPFHLHTDEKMQTLKFIPEDELFDDLKSISLEPRDHMKPDMVLRRHSFSTSRNPLVQPLHSECSLEKLNLKAKVLDGVPIARDKRESLLMRERVGSAPMLHIKDYPVECATEAGDTLSALGQIKSGVKTKLGFFTRCRTNSAQPLKVLITLKSGSKLKAVDSCGTSDPFVRFRHANRLIGKSRVIYRTCNPIWNQDFEFVIRNTEKPIEVKMFDKDLLKNNFIGCGIINLEELNPNE
ncbi:Multiple C2 and transmembrane domain-containing protein 2 [Cichlidogyrus casuarinus]|uniref:Multiple C2 and transmembrane domain-containing protein 2 n=1 Tax=Cichlidogyrus casuarinus TaxID=1844966 RepID=A0ABD2PVP1_9PLAT